MTDTMRPGLVNIGASKALKGSKFMGSVRIFARNVMLGVLPMWVSEATMSHTAWP